MKIFFSLVGFFLLIDLSEAREIHSKWIDLFDGKTTKGWNACDQVQRLEAVNQELHLLSKVNVWVLTEVQMKDFEVQCEVKIPHDYEGFNSGLGFRLIEGRNKPTGYQFEIDRRKPGAVYGIGLGGWLYPSIEQEKEYEKRALGLFKPEKWNHARVRCTGTIIETFLNRKLISEFQDDQSLKGKFGIQHHGKGGIVAFRNLRAREIY